MVVSGTVAEPVLGILDRAGHGVDLTDCGLYPDALQASFGPLAAFVTRANLEPYEVSAVGKRAQQRGELKYLLVTLSPDGELMVRFVLRSQEAIARIRKHLASLQAELPALAVASANIQPAHAAVLEGDLEIPLTERTTLPMRIDDITLDLRPQSFFQTNTAVATELYRQASTWVDEVGPKQPLGPVLRSGRLRAALRRARARRHGHRDQRGGGDGGVGHGGEAARRRTGRALP